MAGTWERLTKSKSVFAHIWERRRQAPIPLRRALPSNDFVMLSASCLGNPYGFLIARPDDLFRSHPLAGRWPDNIFLIPGSAMPAVTFRLVDGRVQEVAAEHGLSVMTVAVANRVPGILGDCGGAQACGTCIVSIAPEWMNRFPPRSEDEVGLLEGCGHSEERARLGCQLLLSEVHEGLIVAVVEGNG
jgi:ferredoxin, 2Fe-2S